MTPPSFYKFILPSKTALFDELSHPVDFEEVGKGRKGNHLVQMTEQGIPIVRTTTQYNQAAHNFSKPHNMLVEAIKLEAQKMPEIQSIPLIFNNALIEIYDSSYFKMKYHSDQCLDLEADSYIVLFSCYERPDELSEKDLRKLKVKNKTTEEAFEFLLENNSVILFSFQTNTTFQHKIVLDTGSRQQAGGASDKSASSDTSDNRWLGITFRKSKTWIQFKNNLPHFPNGQILKLADEAQKKEFYTLRGQENKSMNFQYPEINYTLSISDTMVPKEERDD